MTAKGKEVVVKDVFFEGLQSTPPSDCSRCAVLEPVADHLIALNILETNGELPQKRVFVADVAGIIWAVYKYYPRPLFLDDGSRRQKPLLLFRRPYNCHNCEGPITGINITLGDVE